MARILRDIVGKKKWSKQDLKNPDWARSKGADEMRAMLGGVKKVKLDRPSEHEKNFVATDTPVFDRSAHHYGQEPAGAGVDEARLDEISKGLAARYYTKSKADEKERAQEIPLSKWNSDRRMRNRGKGQETALQKLKAGGVKGLKLKTKTKARVAAK